MDFFWIFSPKKFDISGNLNINNHVVVWHTWQARKSGGCRPPQPMSIRRTNMNKAKAPPGCFFLSGTNKQAANTKASSLSGNLLAGDKGA
ncbi:MAG: hypothetical protein ACD_78C00117G0001 [uncultured bacterium (gcode 4)]|uniref:Uncharacterized protein n=1 Tax=uncultured bacterium (gcode 4) TaxID=1234023 RepID=K1XZ38_9BACT|nr:MAG: hypothetical protein ACD_78C00117G0001 [uncultured bacterium (gcode 4)]